MMFLDTTPDGPCRYQPRRRGPSSADTGRTWREFGSIRGQPAAFTSGQGWYAATETPVYQSTDDGETWSRVL